MTLEEVPTADLPRLGLQLGRLRHDLGKYLQFEVRFLGTDPETEALRHALRNDLYATRKVGDAVSSAWELWAELRPAPLGDDPDVVILEGALGALAAVDLDGERGELERGVALASQAAAATRRLYARWLDRQPEDLP